LLTVKYLLFFDASLKVEIGKADKFSILHFGLSVFSKIGQLFSWQRMLILLGWVIVTLAAEQLHLLTIINPNYNK